MYNRYGDMSKFVTDLDLLELSRDGTVCISAEEDYDIAVDLEDSYASFNELRPYIALWRRGSVSWTILSSASAGRNG